MRSETHGGGCVKTKLDLSPVLMRQQSQVEADINGQEFPLWVECTSRARDPKPYWRVEANRV